MSPTANTQTYFHKEEGFDYEKFFFSIFSFTDPIVDIVQFTTIFIKQSEDGTPYGQYKILDELKRKKEFIDEAEFLEDYNIDLTDTENEEFSIYQIYHRFNQHEGFEPLTTDFSAPYNPLQAQSLSGYFGQEGEAIPKPEEFNARGLTPTKDNFIKVESVYVKLLLEDFSPEHSYYLPLPIIAFGNLVGIIYFVYDETQLRSRDNKTFLDYYRLLFLQATRAYEQILLEGKSNIYKLKPEDILENYWHIFNDLNQEYEFRGRKEQKNIQYEFTYSNRQIEAAKRVITQNPFLLDLGYDDYYDHHAIVAGKESRQIIDAKFERIRTAITTIIVDSFAHNIGAHSLVALKWWFEIRYRIAAKQFPTKYPLATTIMPEEIFKKVEKRMKATIDFHSDMDDFEHKVIPGHLSLLNIIRFMDDSIISDIWQYENDEGEFVTGFPVPVAQSIYHFFQYLRDKSAFWSGVARDTLFSGQSRRWARILRTFLNNTLFLGTIAHSEGINKVFLNIEILNKEGEILVGGEYAQVNLEVMEREKAQEFQNPKETEKPEPYENDEQGYSEYAFLRQGKNYEKIHEQLETMDQVFLPNGIIGQHALYTLIENTLRNIKHYKDSFDTLRKEGVRLCISIQEVPFLRRIDEKVDLFRDKYDSLNKYPTTTYCPMYKIGAWLHHPQKLYNEVGAFINEEEQAFHPKGSIIGSHMQQLRKRVVNQTGQAILGGSSQDKVCAAMLMNNSFMSIDAVNLEKVKRQYFPYIYAASEKMNEWEERVQGFKPQEVILHKAYNPELEGRTTDIRREAYKTFVSNYIDHIVSHKSRGTIKKYFHIWKGERCLLVNQDFDYRYENLARFRLLAIRNFIKDGNKLAFRVSGSLEKKEQSTEYHFRNMGIIRLVDAEDHWTNDDPSELFHQAMIEWMTDWFGKDLKEMRIVLFKESNGFATPAWSAFLRNEGEKWTYECQTIKEIEDEEIYEVLGIEEDEVQAAGIPAKRLHTIHKHHVQCLLIDHSAQGSQTDSSPYICKLRSHTSFFRRIFEIDEQPFKNFNQKRLDGDLDRPLKLIETILTHVSIFDARMVERLGSSSDQTDQPNIFRDQLRIKAYPEDPDLFREKRPELLGTQSHFIVLHLSFIESIYRTKEFNEGKGTKIPYKENEVNKFFEKELATIYTELFGGEIPQNIILVITSGRGRGEWFKATSHPQITFRPIEALLGAVEDGLSLRDDFQVKYNLCNVLMGS